jgi:hypothetical protein
MLDAGVDLRDIQIAARVWLSVCSPSGMCRTQAGGARWPARIAAF